MLQDIQLCMYSIIFSTRIQSPTWDSSFFYVNIWEKSSMKFLVPETDWLAIHRKHWNAGALVNKPMCQGQELFFLGGGNAHTTFNKESLQWVFSTPTMGVHDHPPYH